MKADRAVQRKLLDLAQVDTEMNRVEHQRRTLPELTEITEVEQELRAKQDSLVSAQTAHGDLDREVKRLENEVDQVRQREQRDRSMQESGNLGPKQLEDTQHELTTLERRRGVLEDELLEVMERREATEADVTFARGEVESVEQRMSDAQRRRDEALKDLDTSEANRKADREQLTAELPEELLSLYERVRAKRGIGAAAFQGGRCGACRIELDRSRLTEVNNAAEDDVLQCDECSAIMVRTVGAKS